MRPQTACSACQRRRRKCKRKTPDGPCTHCHNRDIECSLTLTEDENGADKTPPVTTNHIHHESLDRSDPSLVSTRSTVFSLGLWPDVPNVTLPPDDVCEELLELYFRYNHDTFHSLFHRPSLTNEVRNGTVSKVILLSIISLTARFSTHPFFENINPRVRGRPYAKLAERLLNLRDTSVSTIQACMLIGAYVGTEGGSVSESLYFTTACRLALSLDLPKMLVATRLEQEINNRLFWSISMCDVWSSNGVQLPRIMPPRDDVPLPIEERAFFRMRREKPEPPRLTTVQETTSSLLAQMVKLNRILAEISELSRIALRTQSFSFESNTMVDMLTTKLDDWYENLPDRLKDTPENLVYFASRGLGSFFVAVYLGYYHYGQLLYYQYLHEGSHDESSYASPYAEKCKAHSIGLCEILYRSYATPGGEVYYMMVGHVLVIASTVQLHTLLFSSDHVQVAAARSRLERNFEILTRLQSYWPNIDVSFMRLREFHKACQKSKKTPFRLDRWMFQFLYEHMNPIGEKLDDPPDLYTFLMTDFEFSPLSNGVGGTI